MKFIGFATMCLLSLSMVIGAAQVAFAQSADTGAISGTISDKSGAVLPGATITVTNDNTGVAKTTTTNNSGFYSIESVLSGDYTVAIQREGFATSTFQHLHIDPGQRREVSATLKVGSISESMTVNAEAMAVNTETMDNSSTIDSKTIETMLVNGRNFASLAILAPGVNNTTGNNQFQGGGLESTTALSIGGTGTDMTTYSIDGTYNTNTGNYVNMNISPSMDVISEFTVLNTNYSARYGTSSSSQILVDTKSGTNAYHGTVWDYFRNDAMDANVYDEPAGQKQKLHQNIYGYSLGGPVQIPGLYNMDRKQQTFFFASGEWWSKSLGGNATGWVITQAMRQGNFATGDPYFPGSLSLSPLGQSLLAAEGRTNCIASPTTLNPSCIDPGALAIVNAYMPLDNVSNNSNYNYINTQAIPFTQFDEDYRMDQNFGSKHTLTGRFMYEEANNSYPNTVNPNGWGSPYPEVSSSIYTTGLNFLVRLTSTFTPTFTNTAAISATFDKPRLHASPSPIPTGVTIGEYYPNANYLNSIPNMYIYGYANMGPGNFPINASDGEKILNDDFTKVHGKHILQAGGFYMAGIKNQIPGNLIEGLDEFTGVFTGDFAADYLLGLDGYYNQQATNPHYTVHYRQSEVYVQDDWKASPRLTINAGMRFFYYSPDWLSGPKSETSNFDFNKFDPTEAPVVLTSDTLLTNAAGVAITAAGVPANLQNGLVYNTTPGVPRGFYNSYRLHPAPRVGFAYALTKDNRTSIHGGYGVGYTRLPFQIVNAFGQNPPGVQSVTFPYGTISQPSGGAALAIVPTPIPLTLVGPDFKPTQVQNFSLIVEREIVRDAIFQVGYVGSLTHHIQVGTDQNQVHPTSTPYWNDCLPPGQAPSAVYDFDPCLNQGHYGSGQALPEDVIRPYQGYQGLGTPLYEGNANYHSLQTQFRLKRKSVQTTLNYTYGKAMGDGQSGNGGFRFAQSGTVNSYNLKAEYGPLALDRTHIFTGDAIYALPFCSHCSSRLARESVGGWSLSGIAIAQSGFALTPTLANQPFTGLDQSRPNQIGRVHSYNNREKAFNTDVFTVPAYGFFGNASNGSIRGPKEVAFNVALYKEFPLSERVKFNFRAEAFNIANHPSFGLNTGVGPYAINPGQINPASATDPRILEMVARFTF